MDAVRVCFLKSFLQTNHYCYLLYFLLQNEFEFVSAVEDHDVKEASLLRFKRGDIIRIIRRKQIPKGRFEL